MITTASSHPLVVAVQAATSSDVDRAAATADAETAEAARVAFEATDDPVAQAAARAAFEAAIARWLVMAPVAPLVAWVAASRLAFGQRPDTAPLPPPNPRLSARFKNPI